MALIITNGGPRGSTTDLLLVYNYAFKSYDMGMASGSGMDWCSSSSVS